MTAEKTKIIATKQNTCPFCGSKAVSQILTESFSAEPPEVAVVWKKCNDCKKEFTNTYEMKYVGVEVLNSDGDLTVVKLGDELEVWEFDEEE